MKKVILISIALLLYTNNFAQCGSGQSITLSTQTAVDNFISNYCIEFLGHLIIQDDNNGIDNITSLSPLLGLKKVGGVFTLQNNTSLTSFQGLDSIRQVGALRIFYNPHIDSLGGFRSLKLTLGDLWISANENLKNLKGLDSVTHVGGHTHISFNASLTNLQGLEGLRTTSGILIYNNAELNSIQAIKDIDAFSIIFNPLAIEDIGIYNNPTLRFCANNFICTALTIPQIDFKIENNAPYCNTEEQILETCVVSTDNQSIHSYKIFPNPAVHQINIEIDQACDIFIYSPLGVKLLSLHLSPGLNTLDVSGLEKGMYFIVHENRILGKVIKQ